MAEGTALRLRRLCAQRPRGTDASLPTAALPRSTTPAKADVDSARGAAPLAVAAGPPQPVPPKPRASRLLAQALVMASVALLIGACDERGGGNAAMKAGTTVARVGSAGSGELAAEAKTATSALKAEASTATETEANAVKAVSGVDAEAFDAIYRKAPAAKVEIDGLADGIAADVGGTVAKTPIKPRERAIEKIVSEYDGDVTRIRDLARNSIIVPEERINEAVARLRSQGASVKVIDGATHPLGYSGINTIVTTQSGLRAEIQVNTPEMIYAKESEGVARQQLGNDVYDEIAARTGVPGGKGHDLYEQWRMLDPESAAAKDLAEQSKAYYETIRKAAHGNK